MPVTLTNTRNLLEAIADPNTDATPADDHFLRSGTIRLSQGITADEMLQAWRIGLEVVREEAHPVAERLGVTDASRRSLPAGSEDRVAQFAELASTAISNNESDVSANTVAG